MGCTYTNLPEPQERSTEMPATPPLPSPTASPQPTTEDHITKVAIQGNAFVPETVTVSVTDTVMWTNMDSTPHNIKIMGMVTDELDQGNYYVLRFYQKGTFEYTCKLHPDMKGTVIVK
ncbi:MAG: cupredoxin domain-containing protein [ANME-2 cluster archaeon]|nr:cupredoxin domain-containing protein [ANME-2 cluster archaeon]